MFTGIIEHLGTIESLERDAEKARLVIEIQGECEPVAPGESIAVNGVCLTALAQGQRAFAVDLSTETLRRTSFGTVQEGAVVNIERSLTPQKKMSGHFVMGHVDAVGRIESMDHKPGEILIRVSHPADLTPNFIEKGSVALDGISLTVFDCRDGAFTVSIIPFTWEHTNLNEKQPGVPVNLECDMIGKYILKACEPLIQRGRSE